MEELCDILVREIAKDKKSAESEVSRTADYIRFTADTAKSMSGESILSDNFPGFEKNKISVVTREPMGVVLAISPFNYPINLSASKIAPLGPFCILKMNLLSGCSTSINVRYGAKVTGLGTFTSAADATPVLMVTA